MADAQGRDRQFWFIVYPPGPVYNGKPMETGVETQTPEDWIDRLRMCHVPMFISPLHDKDKVADTEDKKPHHHVMVMFDGKKSQAQLQTILDSVGGVIYRNKQGDPIEIQNKVSAARYLCHMDDPQKYQYDRNDVICIGGADYDAIIQRSADYERTIEEMIDFVENHDVISLRQLTYYAKLHNRKWYSALTRNSCYFMKEYIWSRLQDMKAGIPLVDPETGVILKEVNSIETWLDRLAKNEQEKVINAVYAHSEPH